MNRSKSVPSFGGEAFVRGKDGDKICLEEVTKGRFSVGIRNCDNVIKLPFIGHVIQTRQFIIPFHPLYRPC